MSVAGVTAVLIKQHGAGSCDGRLKMKNYNHETLLFLRSYILLGVAPPRGALVDEAQTLAAVENAEEEESGVLHHALRKREYQDKGFWLRQGAQGEGILCVRPCVRACVRACGIFCKMTVKMSSRSILKSQGGV